MEHKGKTRSLLIHHCQAYPKLGIQDVFKFLYQSAFGCEHLVSSAEAAAESIAKEYDGICREDACTIEPLDGSYSRVSLSWLNHGLCADTFGKLFAASAKQEANGWTNLLQKLEAARELVREGLLPFSQTEFEHAAAQWEKKGYPAIHHSELFRVTYKPAYRVAANEYVPFLPLFAELDRRLAEGRVIAAVEGGSASGKTTLSHLLTGIYDCTVFHMDDFFLQPEQRTPERFAQTGGNIDWERFLAEVLLPLRRGEVVNYRKFDCSTMRVGECVQTVPKKLTVIEGAYSMHPELEQYYDFSAFLDISPQLQTERILKRNAPQLAKRFFHEWVPLENVYFSQTNIRQRCSLVIQVP